MKKIFKIVVVLIALGGLCASCHKYPQDELISFETPFKRITAHNWHVVYFGANHQDSTSHTYYGVHYRDSAGYEVYDPNTRYLPISGTNASFGSFDISYGHQHVYSLYTQGFYADTWSFNGNNGQVTKSIHTTAGNDTNSIFYNTTWDILKLTAKYFHISTTFNNKTYEIYFSK